MVRKKTRLYEMAEPLTKKPCTDETCTMFGEIHPRCKAHRRTESGRRPCGMHPLKNQLVCQNHGGGTQKAKVNAEARASIQTYGLPIEISPAQALLQELYRSHGHVAWLASRISEIDPDALVWGLTKDATRPMNMGKEGEDPGTKVHERLREAKINLWLELYQKERKHLAEVSSLCLRANIEQRQMDLLESQAVVLAQVIQFVLADARLAIQADPMIQSVVVRDAMAKLELLPKAA